jgi:hypothetical protein
MAAVTPRVNPEATSTLYEALAAWAGVRRLVTADDPRIACDVLVRSDGARFAWLVSQADEQVTVKPELAPGLTLAALDGTGLDGTARDDTARDGAVSDAGVTLPPFGAGVFRLEASTPNGPAAGQAAGQPA